MMKRGKNKYKLKVQPAKKLMRNLKEKKYHYLKDTHEINEGDKRHANISGDYVAFVE